ncbi:HalOD1 output domain-containing protein [Salinirarus marinus]|uniref:HalOD1 output domain-containing protein n=1 Tax=Salinirarus marinus TaxID=3068310 RepID=UPI003C6CB529
MSHASQADVRYESETNTYRVGRDGDGDVGTAVVRAVAAARDVDPLDVSPLNDVVDPDALNALFESKIDGTPRDGGTVQFTLDGCAVTVDQTGDVVVRP